MSGLCRTVGIMSGLCRDYVKEIQTRAQMRYLGGSGPDRFFNTIDNTYRGNPVDSRLHIGYTITYSGGVIQYLYTALGTQLYTESCNACVTVN